jgi:molecular chaperone GrpE
MRDLLSIIDNLERAVAAARDGGNGKPIVEGVEMVLRSIMDFLRGHGVTQLSAVGQPFDPLLHEAVDSVETTKHQPNTVVDEFVRGYYIGDRLLRPARVTVARLPGPAGEQGSGGGRVENH